MSTFSGWDCGVSEPYSFRLIGWSGINDKGTLSSRQVYDFVIESDYITFRQLLDEVMQSREYAAATSFGSASELIPALGLAFFVTTIICGLQTVPFGVGLLLVHVNGKEPGEILTAAAVADAVFVASPAPNFVVLYGDASKVRAKFGLALPWKGNLLCSPTS